MKNDQYRHSEGGYTVMWGRKRQEREHQELLARLQGLVGKRIYRVATDCPSGLREEDAKAWSKFNLHFVPVTLIAVNHGRLFIRVDQAINDAMRHLLGQIFPLSEAFTDDAWAEWPIPEGIAEPLG